MQALVRVPKFRPSVVALAGILAFGVLVGTALAIATNWSSLSIRTASTSAPNAASSFSGLTSPHRPLAGGAGCVKSVQFHKRATKYCLEAQSCPGATHGPGHVRSVAYADRFSAAVITRLRRPGCTN